MANEFIIKNGFFSNGNSQITGSLNVSGIIFGTLSSSAQIANDISGSFTEASGGFSSRITANTVITTKTLLSSSAQIANDISGSFTEASGGFSSRITTLETTPGGIFITTGSSENTTNNVEITGSLKVTNTVSASFIGNGSALTGIVAVAGPAGPNSSIQFNDSGVTSGSSQFIFNKSNGHVTAVLFSGSGAGLTDVPADVERFYLERIETINNPTSSYIEYFSKPQNSTEIENTASVSGGTYFLECSVLCRNTSLGGRVFINPKIDSTNVFSKPFAREPKSSEDIFYVCISKRITLSAGDRVVQLQLANSGSGTARIFEANIQLTKV